jgi:hypothetical protein
MTSDGAFSNPRHLFGATRVDNAEIGVCLVCNQQDSGRRVSRAYAGGKCEAKTKNGHADRTMEAGIAFHERHKRILDETVRLVNAKIVKRTYKKLDSRSRQTAVQHGGPCGSVSNLGTLLKSGRFV